MISDKESLSGTKLEALFSDIKSVVIQSGSIWKHNRKSDLAESADSFDKFFTQKLNEYAKTLNPKQSVIAKVAVIDVVNPHKANKFILLLDMKHYYESIHYDAINEHFHKADFDVNFIEHIRTFYFDDSGFLRRGLRGSAIISELVGVRIDNTVGKILHEGSYVDTVNYTRYYDDLIFSSDTRASLQAIESTVSDDVQKLDLTINTKKSKLKVTEGSMILGLRIYKSKITVPKRFKKIERSREFELNNYYHSVNWQDKSELYELKRFAGHVIGSLWYIVKNSEDDTTKYSEKIEEFKEILAECDSAIKHFKEQDEEILHQY
jgi:hypothetical protein